MKNLNIDDIEDLRDEMDDMAWESKEINEMLNRDYACDVDEGDLDAELRELEDDHFLEMLDNPVSKNKVPQQEEKVDPYSYSQMMKNTM